MTEEFDLEQKQGETVGVEDKYKQVLVVSPLGREVLADILNECHFGKTLDPDNKAQIAEYNVGVVIMAKCGIFGPDTRGSVINTICNVAGEVKGHKTKRR